MHNFYQKMKQTFISLNTKQVEWNQNTINRTGLNKITQNKIKRKKKKNILNFVKFRLSHTI